MNSRRRALLVANGASIALLAGCSTAPVVCTAACQVPVLVRVTAARVTAGDTLTLCIAGHGCNTYPMSRPPISSTHTLGYGLPPTAYRVTGSLHHEGHVEHASVRLHVSRSDKPCSCPQASGRLRF